MKRITYPNIEGYLNIKKWSSKGDDHIIDIEVIICNFSELQNEENILVDLTVNPGVFQGWDSNTDFTKSYLEGGHRLRMTNFAEILHHGNPITYSERIVIHYEKLYQHKSEINIRVLFGGKHSPLKFSQYLLMIRDISTQNYNNLIVSKEENVIIADSQKKLGVEKRDFLRDYLGR